MLWIVFSLNVRLWLEYSCRSRTMTQPAFNTNLKSLECFRSIIDTGSVTAAGKHLDLTQPAVSRLLGVLENQIGLQLFYRRHGRLVPTPEALALYKEVDVALQSIDRVTQLAENLKIADFGELTIVAPPSLAEGILSHVIGEFIASHPNVRVSLDTQSQERVQDMVALRAVDCGFVKLPASFPGVRCELKISAGTICVMPAGHSLADKRKISVRNLRNEPLVLLGKGKASRLQVDEAFRKAGVRMNVRVETHTVGAACAIARRGVGITIVNEMLAMQFAGKGLVMRRFSPNIRHEYGFMTSSDTPMNRVTQRFLNNCKRYFADKRQTLLLPSDLL
ncbi:MAG: DNA-binding transcriptional LysR family regulator [Lysobacterales bacterium]|jgi:DNA-binding transcriptional LysR family regulator